MGRPRKIVESSEPKLEVIPKVEEAISSLEHAEPSNSPEKKLFNVDEAADYMSVSAETIRLWIDHGHLITQLAGGIRKIPLESMVRCRVKIRRF